ncbi:hypothetical protein [Aureliella helgolandensis]|uniref:Uncharacterized protein n=1 Tax=Aureliella helgolandensis TaxID=2527968 RepID=A0A518G5T5_9BACT|nr:hypothetical protein [Aureliella helgolandensis]QDV23924.1 hypothetical protein Q31a_22340 [Aureliella helgolandensis]
MTNRVYISPLEALSEMPQACGLRAILSSEMRAEQEHSVLVGEASGLARRVDR